MSIDILYEDNHLLIINKPAGLPSQSDLTEDICALDAAKSYIKNKYNKPGNVYASLAHRLDRPVSGVLMICRTSKAMTRMSEQFRSRKVTKTYLAIVNNQVPWTDVYLEDYVVKDRKRNRAKVVASQYPKAKHARMNVYRIHQFGGQTLLKACPITGRSHQIRVQLAHAGYPIIGDVKYGGIRHLEKRAICLHSHALTFQHPIKHHRMTITCLPYQHHWEAYGQLLARVPAS